MSDTPQTDAVLREQYNCGAYPGDSGDGVTAQEAYDGMVSSLEHLCKRLERQLAEDMRLESRLRAVDAEFLLAESPRALLSAGRADSGFCPRR